MKRSIAVGFRRDCLEASGKAVSEAKQDSVYIQGKRHV